jgi:hypothetical protein
MTAHGSRRWWIVPACLGALASAALALRVMGRPWWCAGGEPWLWSGDVWSRHNSQHLLDPYAFTHVTHGVGLYGLLALLVGGRWSLGTRFVAALLLEAAWEVFENTDLVIERYRAVTMSLDYYGDSVANALGDVAACMLGFVAAARLPARVVVAGVVVLEVVLALWIRDGLLLNVVMLVHPVDAIRVWQAGGGGP